jgi:hypothetical protein
MWVMLPPPGNSAPVASHGNTSKRYLRKKGRKKGRKKERKTCVRTRQ